MPIPFRPLLCAALSFGLTCATAPANPNAAKYPSRGAGCKIRVFHTPVPDVKEWDDLGMAHVDCLLDVGAVQCLRRLRSEACRMGGDLLYDVPKKPMRPTEQGMVYAGHVAHTKQKPEEIGGDSDKDDGASADTEPEPAASTAPVEPVEPIGPTAPAARTTADGGGQ